MSDHERQPESTAVAAFLSSLLAVPLGPPRAAAARRFAAADLVAPLLPQCAPPLRALVRAAAELGRTRWRPRAYTLCADCLGAHSSPMFARSSQRCLALRRLLFVRSLRSVCSRLCDAWLCGLSFALLLARSPARTPRPLCRREISIVRLRSHSPPCVLGRLHTQTNNQTYHQTNKHTYINTQHNIQKYNTTRSTCGVCCSGARRRPRARVHRDARRS